MQIVSNNYTSNTSNAIKLGDHIICIYKTSAQLVSLIVPFIIKGLITRNKCIFILGEFSKEEVITSFSIQGFDLLPYIEANDFVFYSNGQTYFKDKVFKPDSTIEDLIAQETEALKQGYTGLRIVGSASWALAEQKTLNDIFIYEAGVSDFIEYSFIIAACLYDESLYKPEDLVKAIRSHPLVYIYDKLVKNPYFIPKSSKSEKYIEKMSYEEIIKGLYN